MSRGERYKTQAEEQAENVKKTQDARTQRKAAEAEADGEQIIAEATFNGFMNCRAVRDGLGFDQPKPNGSYYSAMEVTYNFVAQAGEEIVTLIPDGRTDVPKSERTGVYADAFERVKAHKEAVDAERKLREWTEAMDDAVAREQVRRADRVDGLGRLH